MNAKSHKMIREFGSVKAAVRVVGGAGENTHINIHIDRYIDYVCRYEMFVSTILFFICCLF